MGLVVYEIQKNFEPIFVFGVVDNIGTSILPRGKNENWSKDFESHVNKLIIQVAKRECKGIESFEILMDSRNDEDWLLLAEQWKKKRKELVLLEKEVDQLKQEMIALAKEKESLGGGIRLVCRLRKGLIDYASIPFLKEVDLEPYRKPSTKIWILTEESKSSTVK